MGPDLKDTSRIAIVMLMAIAEKKRRKGFALATVLISSVVLLAILISAISTIVAVRSSLDDQQYTRLAELAGEAGNAYAKACMAENDGQATWDDEHPLKPNTNCSGEPVVGLSEYVYEEDNKRSYFVVPKPHTDNIRAKGYVEVTRTSSGLAWRIWSSDVAMAAGGGGAQVPVGTSIEGYWTTAPTGYLLENGAAVSRTEYAALFAVIGTTYGAGDGTTTFNLPNSQGRVAVNYKSSETEFNTVGKTDGARTHTLTIAEMPSHTHTQNAHNHANPVAVTNGGNAGNYRSIFATNSPFWSSADWNNPTSSTTATNQNTGGGGAHNNLQPYIVVTRAIKY